MTRKPAAIAAEPSRRTRKQLDKRNRIREAAWRLFTTRGYDATTTKSVADEAGVATGTLFLYADDKPDLLVLVYHDELRATFEQARAARARGRTRTLLGDLLAYFAPFFDLYGQEPALAVRFIGLRSTAQGRNAKAMMVLNLDMVAHLGALLGEAIERGEVDPAIDLTQASFNIYAQYLGALMGWALGLSGSAAATFDPALKDSLAMTIRGFGPAPASAK